MRAQKFLYRVIYDDFRPTELKVITHEGARSIRKTKKHVVKVEELDTSEVTVSQMGNLTIDQLLELG